jgi:hypothetical protein
MKIKVQPIVGLLIFLGTQLFIQLAEEFNTMGPENLRGYGPWEWIVLGVNTLASMFVTAKAFIDPGFNGHFDKPQTDKPKDL